MDITDVKVNKDLQSAKQIIAHTQKHPLNRIFREGANH